MHLIIQIPCYNEEETLPGTLADIPRSIEGVDRISILVINDGSSDRTVEVARSEGVDYIVSYPQNRGLARAFMAGIDACIRLGADIIVNTDADNQYYGPDIEKLIRPIIDGEAELVIGDRQVKGISHFSAVKKSLQTFGSRVVRTAAHGARVADATSGFRAVSREAAMRMYVINDFTYTLETIIQAGQNRTAVKSVEIRTNPMTRKSRLFGSILSYVRQSMGIIIRIYTMYRPLKTFMVLSGLFFTLGLALSVRFIYYYYITEGQTGKVQSLIFAAITIIAAFQLFFSGILADLIAANRKLLEYLLVKVRKIESNDPSPSYLLEKKSGEDGEPPAPE